MAPAAGSRRQREGTSPGCCPSSESWRSAALRKRRRRLRPSPGWGSGSGSGSGSARQAPEQIGAAALQVPLWAGAGSGSGCGAGRRATPPPPPPPRAHPGVSFPRRDQNRAAHPPPGPGRQRGSREATWPGRGPRCPPTERTEACPGVRPGRGGPPGPRAHPGLRSLLLLSRGTRTDHSESVVSRTRPLCPRAAPPVAPETPCTGRAGLRASRGVRSAPQPRPARLPGKADATRPVWTRPPDAGADGLGPLPWWAPLQGCRCGVRRTHRWAHQPRDAGTGGH